MENEPGSATQAIVPVVIEIDQALMDRIDASALQQEFEQDLATVISRLGIPARPEVQIRSHRQKSGPSPAHLFLSVNGQEGHFHLDLLQKAYLYAIEKSLPEDFKQASLLSSLAKVQPDQVRRFLRLASLEVVQSQAAILLNDEILESCIRSLEPELSNASPPENGWLRILFASLLNLRIPIPPPAILAQAIEANQGEEKSLESTCEDWIAQFNPRTIEIQLPLAYLKQITRGLQDDDLEAIRLMRDGLFYELGVRIPDIQVSPFEEMEPDCFRLVINALPGIPVRGLTSSQILVNDTPERLALLNMKGEAVLNPANGNPAAIISEKDAQMAETAGLTTWNQVGYLVLAISAELRAFMYCFVDQSLAETYLEDLETALPALVTSVRTQIPAYKVAKALRLLVKEGISIRNLRQILEAMLDFDYIVTDSLSYIVLDPRLPVSTEPGKDWLNDTVNLKEFVRTKMKRYISHKYTLGHNTLIVYLLDPDIEKWLANRQAKPLSIHLESLDGSEYQSLLQAIRAELEALPPTAQHPAILTTNEVRPVLQEMLAPVFPRLPVLSYQELSPDLNIQPIARIEL